MGIVRVAAVLVLGLLLGLASRAEAGGFGGARGGFGGVRGRGVVAQRGVVRQRNIVIQRRVVRQRNIVIQRGNVRGGGFGVGGVRGY